jgi:peptide/nickel transport system permease protein
MSLTGPGELEVVTVDDGLEGRVGLEPDETTAPGEIQGRSLLSIAWRKLRRDRLALAGAVVIILFILVAVFAGPLTALYGQDYKTAHSTDTPPLLNPLTTMPIGPFSGMSSTHWLGITPVQGLDILANLIYGARTSLIVAGLATGLSLVLGVSLGLIAGHYRGWADTIISRIMDVLLSFPTLLFSIALIAVSSYINSSEAFRFAIIIFVLGFFGWPYIGRIVRGQVLSLREKEFVEAARSLGASNVRIMAREIAPNLIGPILVYTTLTIPNNILGEAGLSFLGVGVIPPTPSWGQMLSDAGQYFQVDPFYLFMPGLAIFITVLAFNLFGDGLRDALDPKSTR